MGDISVREYKDRIAELDRQIDRLTLQRDRAIEALRASGANLVADIILDLEAE